MPNNLSLLVMHSRMQLHLLSGVHGKNLIVEVQLGLNFEIMYRFSGQSIVTIGYMFVNFDHELFLEISEQNQTIIHCKHCNKFYSHN